ncbi:MAG: phospho-sugar mutase [Myxococcota bacterium]
MTDVIDRAKAGLQRVDVPDDIRARALDHLQTWWTDDRYADYRPLIETLVTRGEFDELTDAFRQVLPFGTGGRRGRVGVGPNRLNPHTVGTSVQGHADWLRKQHGDADLSVVIAYDVRRFVDVAGRYGGHAGVLQDVSSRDLAEHAARIYAANGITVWLLARGVARYLSTPELSFSIRTLGAQGGLNLSASHNPPDDNGIKVYDAKGGQLVAPQDQALLDIVNAVQKVESLSWEAAQPHLRWLDDATHAAYIQTVAEAGRGPEAVDEGALRALKAYYTPLHGVGLVHEALTAAGFTVAIHEGQATPDGAFPTVPEGVANPEKPEAMAHALAAAQGQDLVFGTDPDADRLGCEVAHEGGFVHLSGNDIAVLVADQTCRSLAAAGHRPLVIVTEVTSRLVRAVAESHGAAVVDNLLVGFKYVADGLGTLEDTGEWQGIASGSVRFAAAGEESHGVLVTDRIRDKDAAGGAVALAVRGAQAKAQGKTLIDVLRRLQDTHGYVVNGQVALRFEGAQGAGAMRALLERLRQSPPDVFAGRSVQGSRDYWNETGRFGPFKSASDRASRNMLCYDLVGGEHDVGARVLLRPSGTEPKLKIYAEVQGRSGLDDAGRAGVDSALTALTDAARTWLQDAAG